MTDAPSTVTVLTPVYNGAEYLSTCIESVLAQTYSKFNYVIVDNWSSDATYAIAQRYASKDSRVVVRRPERHLEIIQNWNFTVSCRDRANRYCKMVHADDWLMPTCLEQMVALADAHPSVGLVGSYRVEETKPGLGGIEPGRNVLPGKEVGAGVLAGRMSVFGSPTQLLVRGEAIDDRKPFFDESLIHADKDSCFRVLMQWDFGFVPQILSFTRRHNESATSALRTLNPRRVENLVMLRRYGAFYLDDAYAAQWRQEWASFHNYLARELLGRPGDRFWQFQRERLALIDETVDRWRLGRELALELGNVTDTVRRLRARFRARPGVVDHNA